MSKLPKYTVSKDDRKGDWPLKNDQSNQVVKRFPTKEKVTEGGALRKAVGSEGGSVKIQKENGRFQEERTYPSSKDPRKSKG